MDTDLSPYLAPTEFIESAAPEIVKLSGSLKAVRDSDTAIALFEWVRDNIRYDPYTAGDGRERYKATAVLARRRGYCVQKAVLLAALGRAAHVPTRLGFADVRNHQIPAKLMQLMGTNLFVYHGYVELFLGGRWVKATPAFDGSTSEKAGVLPVVLDGTNDAMLHPVDPLGHPFIEYVRDRGVSADLPFDAIYQAITETYMRSSISSFHD